MYVCRMFNKVFPTCFIEKYSYLYSTWNYIHGLCGAMLGPMGITWTCRRTQAEHLVAMHQICTLLNIPNDISVVVETPLLQRLIQHARLCEGVFKTFNIRNIYIAAL